MSTAQNIFIDAVQNITTKTKSILKEKDPEEIQKGLRRIAHRRHELDLCVSEMDVFTRVHGRDSDAPDYREAVEEYLKKVDKVIEIAERAGRGEASDFLDADLLGVYIDAVSSDAYNQSNLGYGYLRAFRQWAAEPGTFRQPVIRDTMTGDTVRQINHVTDPLVRIAKAAARLHKDKTINMLFSRANFEPAAVMKLAEEEEPVRMYAMFDSPDFLQSRLFRTKLDLCAFGDTKDYTVRNGRFDLVFARFAYAHIYDSCSSVSAGAAESLIVDDLKRYYRYLAEGGTLLFLVPSFLLKGKERLTIAGHYTYLWNMPVKDKLVPQADMRLVALRKEVCITNEQKDKTYQLLNELAPSSGLTGEMIQEAVEGIPGRDFGPVTLFSGPDEDRMIIEVVLQESTLTISEVKEKKRTIEPLLPLKKGQIGQIIASGRLNGIIDEGNGYKHVISGRVKKESRTFHTEDHENEDDAWEEDRILENNVVEITAVGGDGRLRRIAMTA